MRSFNQVYDIDPGFSRNDILIAQIYPPTDRNEAASFSIDLGLTFVALGIWSTRRLWHRLRRQSPAA